MGVCIGVIAKEIEKDAKVVGKAIVDGVDAAIDGVPEKAIVFIDKEALEGRRTPSRAVLRLSRTK